MKNRTVSNLVILFFLFLSPVLSVHAQMLEPVKWSFKTKITEANTAELRFIANIDKGWHLYSQHLAEGGPMPTEFKIDKTAGIELMGAVAEPKPEEIFDTMFSMKVQFFNTAVTFFQKIKILTDKPVTVKGVLTFQTCNDESCIPGEAEFSFEVPGVKAAAQPAKPVSTTADKGVAPTGKPATTPSTQALAPAGKSVEPAATPETQSVKALQEVSEKAASASVPAALQPAATAPKAEVKANAEIKPAANKDDFNGKKNTEIQTGKFGTNSQPYYVMLDAEGTLFVSPRAYDLNIATFKQFLDAGLEAYYKK